MAEWLEKAMAELETAQGAVVCTERESRQASFAVVSSDRPGRVTVRAQGVAAKARPQEQKERETTKATMLAIRDAVVGVTDATLRQVEMMKTTRDRNIEEIEQQNNRINTPGLGGDGGSGRHGRR